jgi:hypothetical protein
MSRLALAFPAVLALALSGCGLAHVPARDDSGSLNIGWLEDYESAKKAAASSGRPILAVMVAGELKDKC